MAIVNYIQPMTARERFRAALTLYRSHFWKFFQIYLGSTIVVLIVWGVTYYFMYFLHYDSLVTTLFGLLIMPISLFFGMAAVIATSNAVLKRPVKVRSAYERALTPRAALCVATTVVPTLAWALVVRGLQALFHFDLVALQQDPLSISFETIIFMNLMNIINAVFQIGYPFLIIFVPAVSILERHNVMDTLKRALSLSIKNFGRVLVSYGCGVLLPILAVSCLFFCIGAFFMVTLTIDAWAIQLNPQAYSNMFVGPYYLLMAIMLALTTLFFLPAGNLVVLLLYYDIRVRKENYSEDLLAEEMGYKPMSEMMTM